MHMPVRYMAALWVALGVRQSGQSSAPWQTWHSVAMEKKRFDTRTIVWPDSLRWNSPGNDEGTQKPTSALIRLTKFSPALLVLQAAVSTFLTQL